MNADTCKDFLKALELYHDRKFSKMERDTYWSELRDCGDEGRRREVGAAGSEESEEMNTKSKILHRLMKTQATRRE